MSAIYSSLENTVVFVSGGASGIGAAIVGAMIEQKARVAFCDLDANAAAVLCERYPPSLRPWFVRCDIRDVHAYQRSLDAAAEVVGPIRVLVNNAGRDDRHALQEMTPELWDDIIKTNLTHHVFATQRVAPADGGYRWWVDYQHGVDFVAARAPESDWLYGSEGRYQWHYPYARA
jgi:NAD(P)-dependent dehydrogenase (short-subunit alcohol dehydrogenase family)